MNPKCSLFLLLLGAVTVTMSEGISVEEEKNLVDDTATDLTEEKTGNFYQECKRSSDCPQSHCCVMGMMRYQMPYCLQIGRLGDPCHPNKEDKQRRNFTLSFPNDLTVRIDESWLLMCPCGHNLRCSKDTATCLSREDQQFRNDFN